MRCTHAIDATWSEICAWSMTLRSTSFVDARAEGIRVEYVHFHAVFFDTLNQHLRHTVVLVFGPSYIGATQECSCGGVVCNTFEMDARKSRNLVIKSVGVNI